MSLKRGETLLTHIGVERNILAVAIPLTVLCVALLAWFPGNSLASGVLVCEAGRQSEQEPNDRELQATGPICSEDKVLPNSSAGIEGVLAGAPFDGDFGPGETDDFFFVYVHQPTTLTAFLGVNAERTECNGLAGCDPISLKIYDSAGVFEHTVKFRSNGQRFSFALPAAGKYFLDLYGDGEDFVTYNLVLTPGSAISDLSPPPPLRFKGRVKGSGPLSLAVDSSGSVLTSLVAELRFQCADGYGFSARYRFSKPTFLRAGSFRQVAEIHGSGTLGGRFTITGRVSGRRAVGDIAGLEHLRDHGRCTNGQGAWTAQLQA